jgi:hypothetical protein
MAMADANALAILPDGGGVPAGGSVTALLTDSEWSGPDSTTGGGRPW